MCEAQCRTGGWVRRPLKIVRAEVYPVPNLDRSKPTPIVAQARCARREPSARLSAWYFFWLFSLKPPRRS